MKLIRCDEQELTKLIRCDGRELTVRDAGPVLMRLIARDVPIKHQPWRLMDDETARATLRALLDTRLYEVKKK